jgi:hypothetical protein
MKHFFERLQAETPSFFKRLRNLGISITATGTSIVVIPGIPEVLKSHASTAIWVGAVIAAVSQLTVKDTNQLKS